MPFGKYGPLHFPPRGVPLYDLPVEYLAWFIHDRLHSSLDDMPPAEFEALYAPSFFRQVLS